MRQRKTHSCRPDSHKALRALDDEQILAILRGTDDVTVTAARFNTSILSVSRMRRGLHKRARELMAEHGIKPWKKGAWTKKLHPRAPPKPKPPAFPAFEAVTPKPIKAARPDSLLTDDQVRQIMLTAGQVTSAAWAFQLGVSKSTIDAVRARTSKRYIRLAMEFGVIRKTLWALEYDLEQDPDFSLVAPRPKAARSGAKNRSRAEIRA
jgi:hypothetical protein